MSSNDSTSFSTVLRTLHELTGSLAQYLQENSISEPSLRPDSPSEVWTSSDVHLKNMKSRMIDAATDVILLVGGPAKFIRTLLTTHYELASLQVALEFGLLEKIPLRGEISLEELGGHAGFDHNKLARILRLLKTQRILDEPRPGFFAHTIVSATLVSDRKLHASLGMQLDEPTKASVELPNYLRDQPFATKAADSVFKYKFGETVWEFYKRDQVRGARFANAMEGLTHADRSNDVLLNWFKQSSSSERKLVVGVGGGNGHVSITLAKEFSDFKFVVQDVSPDMFSQTATTLSPALKERVSFQKHNFFHAQPIPPVGTVKAFFIRQCLHNWSDEECAEIIQQFLPALTADRGARLLINESVLPRPGEIPLNTEREMRQVDIAMLVMVNSKQRSEEDWKVLVGNADPRLKIAQIMKDSDSGTMGVVEVMAA